MWWASPWRASRGCTLFTLNTFTCWMFQTGVLFILAFPDFCSLLLLLSQLIWNVSPPSTFRINTHLQKINGADEVELFSNWLPIVTSGIKRVTKSLNANFLYVLILLMSKLNKLCMEEAIFWLSQQQQIPVALFLERLSWLKLEET